MHERLNICCLFEKAPSDRRSAFVQLFQSDLSWMEQPSQVMILNVNSGTMTEETWPPSDSLVEQSLENKLFFTYSDWTNSAHRYRSCISLAETSRRAVYTLSFPVSVLRQSLIGSAEQRFLKIGGVAASIENCSILIGPELEIKPTESAKEAILSAIDPASLATWIIVPEKYLLAEIRPFEVVTKHENIVLFRHPDAAVRVGLHPGGFA